MNYKANGNNTLPNILLILHGAPKIGTRLKELMRARLRWCDTWRVWLRKKLGVKREKPPFIWGDYPWVYLQILLGFQLNR